MYIKKLEIRNIRSVSHFEMTFPKPAGWHVLIGDNGSGKTSIVRAIALGLIHSAEEIRALRLSLMTWIQKNQEAGYISLLFERNIKSKVPVLNKDDYSINITISKEIISGFEVGKIQINDTNIYENLNSGWFSAAFGPFRRFTGGDKEWSKVYHSAPRAAAHISIFGEDVALTESLEWLSDIKFKSFESNLAAKTTLESLIRFVNESGLLPHNVKLTDITSEGVFFKDGNGYDLDVTQLSDGFRSMLSMIFELIRQMIKTYSEQEVFKNISNGKMSIDIPGVVLIDEADTHLHPTWQTGIGQWFTKFFPNIQFIVTTHSPLICRACEKGSIWRLASPGSGETSEEITGIAKKKTDFRKCFGCLRNGGIRKKPCKIA
ncbi:MAG: AAA family ATPase [Desulfobacteraceae bacterium]|nr:AAA family ATPase [Desulfobacteraceae bacterium]